MGKPAPEPEPNDANTDDGDELAYRNESEINAENTVGHPWDDEMSPERPRRSDRLLGKHPAHTNMPVVDTSLFPPSTSDPASTEVPLANPGHGHTCSSTGDIASYGNKHRCTNVDPMSERQSTGMVDDELHADPNLSPELPFHVMLQNDSEKSTAAAEAVNKRRRMNPSSAELSTSVNPTVPPGSSVLDSANGPDLNEDTSLMDFPLPPSLLRLARLSPSPTPSETASVSTPLPCDLPETSGKQCVHCQSRTSTADRWYNEKGKTGTGLCGACYYYQHTHHRPRPLHLIRRDKQCLNCQSRTSPHWYNIKGKTGKKICKAGYSYEHRNHRPRPLHLIPSPELPSNCGIMQCSNCSSKRNSGRTWNNSNLNVGWKLCRACYQYENRNHKIRPLSLIQRTPRTLRQLKKPTKRPQK
ncbi:hypothetical protein C8R44DRAFT_766096 [Mycena epipterygia]|nr:hypothetical protein C8R44DRAFT_766096 [Mycena epipterygia]